ncbi:MAG: WG repeat-containing protein, partial [Lachnospiraceae bacterium]|nr:WG repeat-containing protein [Lachnospiraceae bacterium]
AVKSSGKWGFLGKDGKLTREPEYENADSFCAGYAPVYANGKWGVMDVDYNIVIEPKYDKMEAFEKDASAMVELEGKQLRIRMRIK